MKQQLIKSDHEFEKEQGGVYEKVWREKKEEKNNVIILKSQKL